MRLALLPAAVSLALLACAKPQLQISEADQVRAEHALDGQARFLRVATYLGPLWSDTGKAFLTDRPAAEIDLVETPGGKPIPPPAFERILPPGTPVRIQSVEFPTTFVMSERVLVTPRYHPWVFLQVEGERRPCVIVLPQEVKNAEDVQAELERLLTTDDPRPALAELPSEVRELVLRKEAGPGMSTRALEMSWGLPDRKRIDRPAGTEDWAWAGGKRHAFLKNDKVETVER